ncbi:hypothetical protein [Gordonia aichiensis]|uniref:hypothetical protein n=1 Tax=Gordonia aichiensis TaxID=36820 RepID=UPI003266A76A
MSSPTQVRDQSQKPASSRGMKALDELVRAPLLTGKDSHEELIAIVSNLHQLEAMTNVPLSEFLTILTTSQESAATPKSASQTLTAEQEAALRAAGSFVDEMPPAAERASTLALQRTRELLATALTTEQAAERLDVSTGRIRQRLTKRSLLAMKVGTGHRLPSFQFTGDGEVPGWAQVAPVFPESAHLTAVAYFMQHPHSDLTVVGEPVSPITWLTGGGDPEPLLGMITTAFQEHAS